jgi:hypothetical protein
MSHTRSGSFCEAGNGLVSIKQQREQREKEDKARARKEKEEMVMRAQQEQQHEQEQRQQQQQQQNHAATNINNNGNNTIIGFADDEDEDDEMFQLVDIEALETRKHVVAPARVVVLVALSSPSPPSLSALSPCPLFLSVLSVA